MQAFGEMGRILSRIYLFSATNADSTEFRVLP
jgi:hypothetical protein